jgi:cobalt-zinc-cadmium efflux system protein
MLTDTVAIGSVLLAVVIGGRPADRARTFGSARWEVIAAAVNGILLLVVAATILVEAIGRLADPGELAPGPMMLIALLGLGANAVSLAILRAADRDSVALRAARLEVASDLAGSIGVVVAAIVIALTGWVGADAVASIMIAIFIIPRSWRLLRQTTAVLLESTPERLDLGEVRAHLARAEGVEDVHDLHAWSITSGLDVITAHVVIGRDAEPTSVLAELQRCVTTDFDIDHATFQLESGSPCAIVAHA